MLVWIVFQESVIVIVMWVIRYMSSLVVLVASSLWPVIVAVTVMSIVLRVPVGINGPMERSVLVLECVSLLD